MNLEEEEKTEARIPPKLTKEELQNMYKASIHEHRSALDMDVPTGIFEYFKAPGIIVVGILVAYFCGRLNFPIVTLILIIYSVYFLFKRRMDSFKISLQSLIYNQTRKEKVLNNFESMEWLNYMLSRFWTVVEPKISEEVSRNVNTLLYEKCPPFLQSIKLKEFTLGSVPPKISGITFNEKSGDDLVQIDAECYFIPLEISKDSLILFKNPSTRVEYNSRVLLVVRVAGNNQYGIDVPILVTHIAFKARARIILTIVKSDIFIRDIEFCLMEDPYINFVLKPLKIVDLMDFQSKPLFFEV